MAVPNPEQELMRLRKLVEKGLPRVLVITGPADFFRSEAWDIVRARVPEDADVQQLSGDQTTSGEELQGLRGASLFGRGCWLLVRRAEGWIKQHGEALAAVLDKMAPRCGLVIEAAKLDRRTRLGKQLAQHALFECRALYTEPYDRTRSPLEAEMVAWIQRRAREAGVSLSSEAALLVMRTVGTDPAECVAELARIARRPAPKRGALGPDDIKGLLSCSFESTPFEFAEALLDGDRRRASRSLEAMFERGVRGREGDAVDRGGVFPFVASWLYQSLANTYEGRFLLDHGVPLADIPQRVGVRAFIPRFQQQVLNNPEPRLRCALRLLHRAQRDLRLTGEDPLWLLRRFVDRFFEGSAA